MSSVVAFSRKEGMEAKASFVGAKMVRSGVESRALTRFVAFRAP
jgi:hypothetical protein